MIRSLSRGLGIALLAVTFAAPASAQGLENQIAVETHFRGYSFDAGLGPEVANILLTPVAFRRQLNDEFSLDVYTAWGRGQVEQENVVYQINGLVDSRVRVAYRAREWASVSASLNVPTGNAQHDGEESLVASVLSSDLLGFRESTWGMGVGLTTGVATASRVGEWGLGFGASYRLSGEFEPVADSSLGYQPGNEVRLRAGIDRNIGESGTFAAGLTFQNFSGDRVDGRNLFQAGNRVSLDASYAFRTGASTWSVSLVNIWRENGDLFLDLVDSGGAIVGDTTLVTAKQALTAASVNGSIPIGSQFRVRPSLDLRIQGREEADGTETGSGYVMEFGADLPLRLLGVYDLFPRVQYLTGQVRGSDGGDYGVNGFSVTLTLRWRF